MNHDQNRGRNNINQRASQARQPQAGAQPRQTAAQGSNAPRSGGAYQTRGNGSSMSRISSHTPSNRRAQPRSQVKLTPEQIEINRVNRQREIYYIKKRRSAAIKTFLSRFVIFVFVFALMGGIFGLMFYFNLTRADSADNSGYSYTIGDNSYSLSYEKAVRDGRAYINFSHIAEYCGFSRLGTLEDIKYVVKGDGSETIRFIANSRRVYVNDVETRLGGECYISDGDVYVPADFVAAYIKGLDIEINEGSNDISVLKIITNLNDKGKLNKGQEPEYAPISFLLQSGAGLDPISEEGQSTSTLPDLQFVNNLDFYEEYMNPGNTVEYLTLVNKEVKLDSTYVPQDLTSVSATRDDGRATQQLRKNAAMALEALFIELRSAGFEDVSVTSGYRSYSYQETLFNGYLAQHNNDYEYVSTFSNPPGSSEHQTGLCVDMHNIATGADVSYANDPSYTWLKENCWKFGFILRYPENKTEITDVSFEPWHYRYVGRYHAQRMYQSGMCLEEYAAQIGAVQ